MQLWSITAGCLILNYASLLSESTHPKKVSKIIFLKNGHVLVIKQLKYLKIWKIGREIE